MLNDTVFYAIYGDGIPQLVGNGWVIRCSTVFWREIEINDRIAVIY